MQPVNTALLWVSSYFGVMTLLSWYSKIIAQLNCIVFSYAFIVDHQYLQNYAEYIYMCT